jgi:prophage DNA circulation protein
MGTLAQYGHRTGIRPDYAMSTHERDEKSAAERLATKEQKRDKTVRALPDLERTANEAFRAVQHQAEVKLAELQERAALAREVKQEKMQAQLEADREQAREHKLDREQDRGMER